MLFNRQSIRTDPMPPVAAEAPAGPTSAELQAAIKAELARQVAANPLHKLQAQLQAAQERESAEAARQARAASAARDEKVRRAYRDQAKASAALQNAVSQYVEHWYAFIKASEHARAVAQYAPRSRKDLVIFNVAKYVADEITRANGGRAALPPGADAWTNTVRDPRTITPLAVHFSRLAEAIIPRQTD
jgi:hypothetical protein